MGYGINSGHWRIVGGKKINKEFTKAPQFSNWKGAAKVSYDGIIQLESTFGPKDNVYPYISPSGNFDVFEYVEFLWPDEIRDGEVDNLNVMIRFGNDFEDHIWGSVEDDDVDGDNIHNIQKKDDVEGDSEVPKDGNEVPQLSDEENHVSGLKRSKNKQAGHGEVSGLNRSRKKQPDHGAETQKKEIALSASSNNTWSF